MEFILINRFHLSFCISFVHNVVKTSTCDKTLVCLITGQRANGPSHTLQNLRGPCTGKDVGAKSGCGGLSFGTVQITDLDFADDAVLFAERTEVLAGALDSLSQEAEPLGLRVSWIKTNVQAFDDILDATVESIPVRMWKSCRRLSTWAA